MAEACKSFRLPDELVVQILIHVEPIDQTTVAKDTSIVQAVDQITQGHIQSRINFSDYILYIEA